MIAQKKRQYITDHNGRRVAVVLDVKTYEKMQDELDDYYSKRAYEKAKPLTDREIKRGDFVTVAQKVSLQKARNFSTLPKNWTPSRKHHHE